MAVNPIQFLVAQNASITDGTKTITISGNVDCSRVFSGTAVFLGGTDNPAEAISGTAPDGSGNSTITLRNNWSQGDVINQQLVSFNTNEGLAEAISNVREIVSNVSAIEDLATQGLIKRISDNVYEVVNISAVGESLITASDASSQRSVLGLGSAATKNVGTSVGQLMEVGAGGLLADQAIYISDLTTSDLPNGFYKFRADINGAPKETAGSTLWYVGTVIQGDGNRATYNFTLVTGGRSRQFVGERIATSGEIDWRELHSPTTTKIDTFDFTDIPDISGFYAVEGSTNVLNAPQTSGNMQILNLSRTTTIDGKVAYASMLVIDRDTAKTYVGSYNIARSAGDKMRWYPLYSSNTIGEVDFNYYALRSFGSYYPSTANRDIDGVASGDIGLYATGNQGSFPFNPNIGFYHITTQKNYTGEARTQFATGYFGTNAANNTPTYSMRSLDNAGQGWTPWVNFFHSGNSVNPLDYGLGASVTREAKDWNSALKAGFWRSTSGGGQVNSPDDSQAGWYGFVAGLNDNNIHQQVTLPSSSNSRTYMRTMQSGIWSPWVEIYHSGNTNFNEFGGNGVGRVVAVGFARNANEIIFPIAINSTIVPSSISVNSTFTIENSSLFGAAATGLVPVLSSSESSNKIAVVRTLGLTGLTAGQLYYLTQETASSKITINF